MSRRLFGVLALSMLLSAAFLPGVALADEADPEADEFEVEHEELPGYEEIGTGTETSLEFRPEPYEEPTVFSPMVLPLLGAGFLVLFVVGGLYLLWHPRFSQEAREKRRRR